jgi:hypothetical protein
LECSVEAIIANFLFLDDTKHARRNELLSPWGKDILLIKPLGNLFVRPAFGSELSDSIK